MELTQYGKEEVEVSGNDTNAVVTDEKLAETVT